MASVPCPTPESPDIFSPSGHREFDAEVLQRPEERKKLSLPHFSMVIDNR